MGFRRNRLALSQAAKSSIQRASRLTEVGASYTLDSRQRTDAWKDRADCRLQSDDSAEIGSVYDR